MSYQSFDDPSDETHFGLQLDRETFEPVHDDQPPPWNEGDRLNEFTLEKLLGSGRSGFVYRAFDVCENKRMALKLLRPGSPDNLLRNKLGFRKMMPVEHPNLVRVDRIHQLGSYVALSMEEVEGITFRQTQQQLHRLEPSEAYDQLLGLLHQFASGLAELHRRGLVHRDVKPANMMIRSDGVAKLIDYGLVERFQLDELQCNPRGDIFGTPRYIAPEVYWRQQYLPSGDVFGLGISFLETLLLIQDSDDPRHTELTRSRSDQGADGLQLNNAIDDLPDSVPMIIRDTCRQMLSRHPVDRPTAIELSRVGRSQSSPVALSLHDAIVGREPELARIQAWVDNVFNGSIGRLHLSGPSGIGKSRLAEEVIEYVESRKWGQLFHAKCQIGEDQPMQAFDQIFDEVASRYMRGDREPLELDPVSVTILKSGFPVLSSVLKARMDFAPPQSRTEVVDALEAAVRMSEQLRLVGPLFLVIDDSQWADEDSKNLLYRLSNADGTEGIGIITISREPDSQRSPAQNTLELGPLSLADSVFILSRSADHWKIELDDSVIQQMAVAAHGSPFRLREVASEFRPGGALADRDPSIDKEFLDFESIDQLWRRRAERLSEDAKRLLPYVATAGARMSTVQLGELTGLRETVDAAVSELARQRLVTDEATGGECIQIVNDRIANEMTRLLGDQAKRNAHHDWASYLARHDDSNRFAARIAGHFFAADEPGQAVSHTILAAEDADKRNAKYEAAKLYRRVAGHVEGSERIDQLRNAARCFREADHPIESAACFQDLAEHLDENERFDDQLMAITLLIRAGRFDEVRSQLRELATRIRMPKPKSASLATLALFARQVRLTFRSDGSLLAKLTDNQNLTDRQPVELHKQTLQQLDLCFSLVRPLSFFDNLYAAELSMVGAALLLKHSDPKRRFHAAVGEAVFACYDSGRKRTAGEAQLAQLRSIATRINRPSASGDVASGTAISHLLASRWCEIPAPVKEGIEHYQQSSDPFEFEIAHTTWAHLWAMWHLGQWSQLCQNCFALYDDGDRRNDRFQQIVACSGYAVAAWLVDDKVIELKRIQAGAGKPDLDGRQLQLVQVFHWVGSTMRQIYAGRYDRAWTSYQQIKPKLAKRPFSSMQFVRILRKQLGVLIALHQLNQRYREPLVLRASLLIDELRKEQSPYASVLANLYGGLLTQKLSLVDRWRIGSLQGIRLLSSARDEARIQQLVPLQLAASDALVCMELGSSPDQLSAMMRAEGVRRPLRFERLFTITFDRRTSE